MIAHRITQNVLFTLSFLLAAVAIWDTPQRDASHWNSRSSASTAACGPSSG